MKFKAEVNNRTLSIPRAVLKLSGVDENTEMEINALNNAIVLLKKPMTVRELMMAVDSLNKLSASLVDYIIDNCEACDGCDESCNRDCFQLGKTKGVYVPDELLAEAGFPKDAEFEVMVDKGSGEIVVCEAEDKSLLAGIPPAMIHLLNQTGICVDSLRVHLESNDHIYR